MNIIRHVVKYSGVEYQSYQDRSDFAASLKESESAARQQHDATLARIIQYVCLRCECSPNDLVSSRRFPHIVRVRFIFIWLARHLTSATWARIGKEIGYADHTSVKHGFRRAQQMRQVPHYQIMMDEFRKELSEEFMG